MMLLLPAHHHGSDGIHLLCSGRGNSTGEPEPDPAANTVLPPGQQDPPSPLSVPELCMTSDKPSPPERLAYQYMLRSDYHHRRHCRRSRRHRYHHNLCQQQQCCHVGRHSWMTAPCLPSGCRCCCSHSARLAMRQGHFAEKPHSAKTGSRPHPAGGPFAAAAALADSAGWHPL